MLLQILQHSSRTMDIFTSLNTDKTTSTSTEISFQLLLITENKESLRILRFHTKRELFIRCIFGFSNDTK